MLQARSRCCRPAASTISSPASSRNWPRSATKPWTCSISRLRSDPRQQTPMTVPAGYVDGRSAHRYPVIVSIDHGTVFVEGEGVSRREPVVSLHITEALGSSPRILRFADGAFCEVMDHVAFRQLLAENGIADSRVSQWE